MTDTALVVGEALIDIVQHEGQALGEHVGGSPLNVAVGLALLGRRVRFLTWIGNDRRGRRIADYLHDSGVDLDEGSVGATRTATARAELDEKGSATYQFDIEWQLSPNPGLMAPLVLHTGSIATALEPGCDAVAELIDALWDLGLLGGHRRGQLRVISSDVLREVLKVAALSAALTVARPGAALPDRATRDRAAHRLTGD